MKFTINELKSIHKLCDALSISDANEDVTIKALAKEISTYLKAIEDYKKIRNWGYNKEEEGIKTDPNKPWSSKTRNFENSKYEYLDKLREKPEKAKANFYNILSNSRRSIQVLFKDVRKDNFEYYISKTYSSDFNQTYDKIKNEYEIMNKETKVRKMKKLSSTVSQIVGNMGVKYHEWDRAGAVKYNSDKNAFQISLGFAYGGSDRGKLTRGRQVLKEVKKIYPNAYIDESSSLSLIFIPEEDVSL